LKIDILCTKVWFFGLKNFNIIELSKVNSVNKFALFKVCYFFSVWLFWLLAPAGQTAVSLLHAKDRLANVSFVLSDTVGP
jgi:hypothetical protein